MTRRIVWRADIDAVGTIVDWSRGPYERKPDGPWRFEVTVKDPTMQGTPHGPDEPTLTFYPLADERELDDPPVFLLGELLDLLGDAVPQPKEGT